MLLGSCAGEFNKVYKSSDTDYNYEYARRPLPAENSSRHLHSLKNSSPSRKVPMRHKSASTC